MIWFTTKTKTTLKRDKVYSKLMMEAPTKKSMRICSTKCVNLVIWAKVNILLESLMRMEIL